MKKHIGIIGLGKMGSGIALQLKEKGWDVSGYDSSESTIKSLSKSGIATAESIKELVQGLSSPRMVWLMIPARAAGKGRGPVDEALFGRDGLASFLKRGDTVIDGGNSFFKEAIARTKKLRKLGIAFIDVGFSGGPSGARSGGCLMIGGDETAFKRHESLFRDLAVKDGYQFFKGAGAGHFVKMIHNGIEYGMMQAIAEGFAILKKSKYKLPLKRVADIYNHGSVIESRLIGWTRSAFDQHGEDLKDISGSVGHTGEGEWTSHVAHEMKIPIKIIEESFKFRVQSAKSPSYQGQVVSALRGQFGGHRVKK